MARKGENIYKRKDGRWEARYIKSYTETGKAKYRYIYAKTYSEVKAKMIFEISNNKSNCTAISAKFLFSEINETWLNSIKLNCKISTYNKYRNISEKFLVPYFYNYPVNKISGEMVDSFLSLLLLDNESGKIYSKKYTQDICMVLKQIFKFAEENYNLIPQFPLKKLKIQQKPKETDCFSKSNIEMLCRYLYKNTDLYKLGVLICIYTGMRIGEVCALKWEDISFDDGFISVSKTAQRIQQLDNPLQKTKLIITTPKSESSNRIIPIPMELKKIMQSFRSNNDYYVLSASTKCVEPRTLQNHYTKYLQECGIQYINFHSLRHTFATTCISLGVDAKTLSEILGHSSVNITLNRYVHSSFSQKQNAMNKVSFNSLSPSEL